MSQQRNSINNDHPPVVLSGRSNDFDVWSEKLVNSFKALQVKNPLVNRELVRISGETLEQQRFSPYPTPPRLQQHQHQKQTKHLPSLTQPQEHKQPANTPSQLKQGQQQQQQQKQKQLELAQSFLPQINPQSREWFHGLLDSHFSPLTTISTARDIFHLSRKQVDRIPTTPHKTKRNPNTRVRLVSLRDGFDMCMRRYASVGRLQRHIDGLNRKHPERRVDMIYDVRKFLKEGVSRFPFNESDDELEDEEGNAI